MEIAQVSSREIAIRMMIIDHQKRDNDLILISTYAPIGVDSDEAWTSFFEDYDTSLKMCKINGTIIAGMDRNLSLGTNVGNICVPSGVPDTNNAGRRKTFSKKNPTEHGSIHAQNSFTNRTTSSQTRTNSETSQMQELQRAW